MIQPEELRIGNLLKWSTTIHRVESILNKDYDFEFGCIITNYFDAGRALEEFEPIPLTSELLEKCGFVLDKGVGVWFDKKEHDGFRFTFTLWDSHEGRYLFTREMPSNHIPVFHLHQLQNLYFALTNSELTIEL